MIPQWVSRTLWRFFTDLEPLTFQARTSGDTFSPYNVPRALRRPLTTDQIEALGGIVPQGTINFDVAQEALDEVNAPVPNPEDIVTDASNISYTVISAKATLDSTFYQLICQQQR